MVRFKQPNPLPMLHFEPSQTASLGSMGSPNPSPCFILSLPHHTLENKSKQRSTWEKKEFNQIPFERDPPGERGFILGTFLAQAPLELLSP